MVLSTHGEHHWNNSIQNIGYSGYNQTDLLVKKHVWGGLVSFTYQWFIWGVHSIDQPTNWKSYDCKGHRQNDVENQWIQRHQHPKYKGNMGEEFCNFPPQFVAANCPEIPGVPSHVGMHSAGIPVFGPHVVR